MFSEQQGRGMPTRSQTGYLTRRDLLQRAVALGVGGSAMLALLDACGTTSSVDLTYWNLFGGGDGVRMEEMESSYSTHYPEVSLESVVLAWGAPYYTKLAMAAAGGRPPDVAVSHMTRMPIFAQQELLDPFDLNELSAVGISEEKFLPEIWQRASYNGKLYSIPLDTHPFVLYYNIDVCQKAGLLNADNSLKPLEGPDALIDAFKRAQEVTGNLGLAAEAGATTSWRLFLTLYSQMGGELLSADGQQLLLDEDKAVQVLTFMADLTIGSKVASPTLDYPGAIALFGNGQAGFTWNGEWEITTFQGIDNFHFNMVPFPKVYQTYKVQADCHAFVLPHQLAVDPDKRANALKLISFMLNNSLEWAKGGHIPAYLPVTESTEYQQLKPQSNYASVAASTVFDPIAWFSGSGSQLESDSAAAFQQVVTGAYTPLQGVRQFKETLQKYLSIPPLS